MVALYGPRTTVYVTLDDGVYESALRWTDPQQAYRLLGNAGSV